MDTLERKVLSGNNGRITDEAVIINQERFQNAQNDENDENNKNKETKRVMEIKRINVYEDETLFPHYELADNDKHDLNFETIKIQTRNYGSKFYKITKETIIYTFNPFKRFPILNWLPKYKLSYIPRDVIAGLTCGLTLIPEGLAYGRQAGLPSWYGLYSSWMAPIVYCLMGGSKDIADGPTAILSHMVLLFTKNPSDCIATGEFKNGNSPPEAVLLAFLVCLFFGCFVLYIGS